MSENFTKRDIVLKICDLLSEQQSPSGDAFRNGTLTQRDVRDTVQLTLDVIRQAIAEGRNVELRNFGVFQLRVRKPRVGRNPNQPEKNVVIPERVGVRFKAGKELRKDLVSLKPEALGDPTEA